MGGRRILYYNQGWPIEFRVGQKFLMFFCFHFNCNCSTGFLLSYLLKSFSYACLKKKNKVDQSGGGRWNFLNGRCLADVQNGRH